MAIDEHPINRYAIKNMEKWRPVFGHEKWYEVSNKGRIRSLSCIIPPRKNGGLVNIEGKILRTTTDNRGYLKITLRRPKIATYCIHRMVITAFRGPSRLTVNHIDFNKKNNLLKNLEFLSNFDNQRYSANINTEDRKLIRASKDIPDSILAGLFNVSRATIWHIQNRELF